MAHTMMRPHQPGDCECGCGCGGQGESPTDEGTERRRWDEVPDDEVVCECGEVSKKTIVEAVLNGAYTVPLIKILTGVGRGHPCPNDHECLRSVRELIGAYGSTTLSDALVSSADDPHDPRP